MYPYSLQHLAWSEEIPILKVFTEILSHKDFWTTPHVISIWSETETGGELASNPTYGSLLNNTFLDEFSLEQLVLGPTHENHILDLVLTSIPGLFTDVTIVLGMSDHEAVTFRLNATVKRLTKVKRKIFLFHKANLEGMKAKLQRFEKDFIESDPFG